MRTVLIDDAALGREARPRRDVAVMIQLGHDDLVALRPTASTSPRARWKVSVVMFRPNAISVAIAVHEIGERHTRRVERGVGLGARRIVPVRVRVMVEQVVVHRLDDLSRHLRAARPVEVRDRAGPRTCARAPGSRA